MIIKSDYRLPSVTDGYGVLLRNKHLNDSEHELLGESVLFVHGATYGSTLTFDFAIDGESWMDAMAMAGFDVWCLDLLGYGGSDRPHEMNQPAEANAPLVDTAHAVAEVDRAVDYILKDRDIPRINLIAYSWGSAICGSYAGQFAGKVAKLVLSGALWVSEGAGALSATKKGTIASGPGAYRTVDAEAMAKRWAIGLEPEAFEQVVSPEVVSAWCEAVVNCDPEGPETGVLRAPTGVQKDFLACSASGKPWYDPSLIQAPTQIVVGELDRETTPGQGREVFQRLTGATEKRMTVIGGGTHSLLLENQRAALYDVVSSFFRPVQAPQ